MKSFKIHKPIITFVIFIFLSVLSYTILINEKSKSTKKDLNSKVSVETQFKLRLFNVPGFNDQLNIDAGLAYLIQDKLQFDAYFGTGLNNKMVFASVGLSYLYLK